ncbi:MAG: M1 family aminopeptidase [Candidatus Sulfotelmatobacter sp.]
MKRILATAAAHTYVTKVPLTTRKSRLAPVLLLASLIVLGNEALGSDAAANTAEDGEGAPARSLYLQLNAVGLDPTRVFRVREISLDRPAIHITLEDGTIAFTQDVMGKITGAFFAGEGEVLLVPPNDVERRSMSLFTGMAILEERFNTAYFRFNDATAAKLEPGLRAPEDAAEFVARWNDTARTLAHADAMRLLSTFSRMLPPADAGAFKPSAAAASDPADRLFHARLQGNKLGAFDIFFDATAGEQVEAGQAKRTQDGNLYFNVWTSFAIEDAQKPKAAEDSPPTRMAESAPGEDPVRVRSYAINARVKPPKELDAEVQLHIDVLHSGARSLVFELSRYLQIQKVESEGKALEFIQNPAVEGTELARNGNDLVAVILPAPAHQGHEINLRFVYAGEVLAEAGPGLLYVGARGNWYPNRGLVMADFDLTFHYPPGWTLVATGKPASVSTPKAGDDQASRWVSERPVPVAGFDLGKYVRATASAGNVVVEAYATAGVERDFPKPSPQPSPLPDPALRPGIVNPTPVPPLFPSPARNAADVADAAARALGYYADRFGPFPYSKLALTQLPGRESQGWPGLIFLSSYAFLTTEESESLHASPSHALLDRQIPAHEAAHQWWGDLVTWSSYRDQWFSEGLANYCSLMMLQEKNPAAFREIMDKYRRDLVEKDSVEKNLIGKDLIGKDQAETDLANTDLKKTDLLETDLPKNDLPKNDQSGNLPKDAGPVTLGSRLLSSEFPKAYQVVTYGRGTWLFHMLRSMLQDAGAREPHGSKQAGGDDPFLKSLRKVRERYQGKTISTRELLDVFAEDLPRSLRYEGKASLDWFLEGWVNGTSLPRLELQSVKFTPKEKEAVVTGVIRQKDAPEDLVTSVPIYAVISGRSPVLLGRVFAAGAESPFTLSAPLGAHKLLLDPNGTILTHPR